MPGLRNRWRWPFVLLLLGLGLRLHHLTLRALWWDEGLSVFFSQFGYFENARLAVTLADTNPPFYRLLLGGWLALLGDSAWATRLLSVLAGVVLLAVVWRLAREIRLSFITATLAMALATLSPMLIYYAQEAKGYSLEALAGVSAVVLWWRLHRHLWPSSTRPAHLALWGLFGLALLFSIGVHYIAVFLIFTLNVGSALVLARRYGWAIWRWPTPAWRQAFALGAVQTLVMAALLPYVLTTFAATRAIVAGETTQQFTPWAGPLAYLADHAGQFAAGPHAQGWVALVSVGVLGGLAGWGALRMARASVLLLGSWLLVPVGLGLIFSAIHPFFFPRFLLYSVPAMLVLAAAGLTHLPRPATVSLLLAILLSWAAPLATHYTRWDTPDEDWRPVAAALAPYLRAGDGAIYVWGWIPGYLQVYLPPNTPAPDYFLGFFTPETLDPEMGAITASHDRVWLLDYQVDALDSRNLAGNWLSTRYGLAYTEWIGTAHLALWVAPSVPTQPEIEVTFENGVRLRYAPLYPGVYPGDALAATLTWQAPDDATPPPGRVFFHLIAPDGTLANNRDTDLLNGIRPLEALAPGEAVTEARAIVIPNVAAEHCGFYVLRIGVYDPVTGERWRLADGRDYVEIGNVVMLTSPSASP